MSGLWAGWLIPTAAWRTEQTATAGTVTNIPPTFPAWWRLCVLWSGGWNIIVCQQRKVQSRKSHTKQAPGISVSGWPMHPAMSRSGPHPELLSHQSELADSERLGTPYGTSSTQSQHEQPVEKRASGHARWTPRLYTSTVAPGASYLHGKDIPTGW